MLDTNDNSSHVITHFLGAWLLDKKFPELKEIVPVTSTFLQQAVTEQTELGCKQWFQGRITLTWSELN
jgi:hypothetical protein